MWQCLDISKLWAKLRFFKWWRILQPNFVPICILDNYFYIYSVWCHVLLCLLCCCLCCSIWWCCLTTTTTTTTSELKCRLVRTHCNLSHKVHCAITTTCSVLKVQFIKHYLLIEIDSVTISACLSSLSVLECYDMVGCHLFMNLPEVCKKYWGIPMILWYNQNHNALQTFIQVAGYLTQNDKYPEKYSQLLVVN